MFPTNIRIGNGRTQGNGKPNIPECEKKPAQDVVGRKAGQFKQPLPLGVAPMSGEMGELFKPQRQAIAPRPLDIHGQGQIGGAFEIFVKRQCRQSAAG